MFACGPRQSTHLQDADTQRDCHECVHLAVNADDGGGGVQAQVFAHVAIDGDAAPEQQGGRVQRSRAAHHVLRSQHDLPLAAAGSARGGLCQDAGRCTPPHLVAAGFRH
jgi:hypothetical protein